MHRLHPSRRFLLPEETEHTLPSPSREGRPSTLLLTCTDSILDSSLIQRLTSSSLFLVRRPGNRFALPDEMDGGLAELLERLVADATITDIVVCGHSQCSAIQPAAAPSPSGTGESWYERTVRRIASAASCVREGKANVTAQLEALEESSVVAAAIGQGTLRLHGAFYLCESGAFLLHDAESDEFVLPPEPLCCSGTGRKRPPAVDLPV